MRAWSSWEEGAGSGAFFEGHTHKPSLNFAGSPALLLPCIWVGTSHAGDTAKREFPAPLPLTGSSGPWNWAKVVAVTVFIFPLAQGILLFD